MFDESRDQCQASAFALLTVLLAVHSYNALHQRHSFVSKELVPLKQVWILRAPVWISIASLFLTFYVEWIRKHVFEQGQPTLVGWGLVAGFAVLFLATSELYKYGKRIYFRRRLKRRAAAVSNLELAELPPVDIVAST